MTLIAINPHNIWEYSESSCACLLLEFIEKLWALKNDGKY